MILMARALGLALFVVTLLGAPKLLAGEKDCEELMQGSVTGLIERYDEVPTQAIDERRLLGEFSDLINEAGDLADEFSRLDQLGEEVARGEKSLAQAKGILENFVQENWSRFADPLNETTSSGKRLGAIKSLLQQMRPYLVNDESAVEPPEEEQWPAMDENQQKEESAEESGQGEDAQGVPGQSDNSEQESSPDQSGSGESGEERQGSETTRDSGAESGSESGSESGTESGAEAGSESGTESGGESEPDSSPDESGSGESGEEGQGSESTQESGAESGVEPGTESGAESESESGAESGNEPGSESGAETGSESGSESGAESGSESGSQPSGSPGDESSGESETSSSGQASDGEAKGQAIGQSTGGEANAQTSGGETSARASSGEPSDQSSAAEATTQEGVGDSQARAVAGGEESDTESDSESVAGSLAESGESGEEVTSDEEGSKAQATPEDVLAEETKINDLDQTGSEEGDSSVGKGESGQSFLADTMAEHLKNLMDKLNIFKNQEEQEAWKPNLDNDFGLSHKTSADDVRDPAADWQQNSLDSTPSDVHNEELPSRPEVPRLSTMGTSVRNLDLQKLEEMPVLLVRRLWRQVLSQYNNSEKFLAELRGFKQFLEYLIQHNTAQDYLIQSQKRAEEMIQRLNSYPVKYDGLEKLGLSMMGDTTDVNRQIQLKLMYLLEILVTKNEVSSLTSEEKQLMVLASEILRKTSEMESEATDENIGRGFLKQLIGPLSYSMVKTQFPAEQNSMDTMDWASVAQGLKSGNLNDLLFMSQTSPYLKLRDQSLNVPQINQEFTGPVVEFSEGDRDIESANDLDRWKHFLLSGGPAEFDMFTFLSDDMLEHALREEVERADPVNEVPRKVTIILADVSGSMEKNRRYIIRNSLVAGYVDHAGRENLSGDADHLVLYIPFDGKPHDGETLKDPGQFKDFFARILKEPPGSGDSTSITNALVHAFQKIFEAQESGGPFARASVLLVTDGDDDVDIEEVAEAQERVSSETEIFLNAITIDKGNAKLEKFISESEQRFQESADGKVRRGGTDASYFHITGSDIDSMLDSASHIEAIESYSRTFDLRLENSVSTSQLLDIRRLLISMEREQKRDLENLDSLTRSLDMLLRQSASTGPERSHDEGVMIQNLGMWLDEIKSLHVSGSWSTALRAAALQAFFKSAEEVASGSGQVFLDALSEEEVQKLRTWAL